MQLKSIFKKNDFFERFKSNYFDVVKIMNISNTTWEKNYEMKKIVDKRVRIYDKIIVTQYFVKWFEYESIYDEWKFIVALIEFIDFIENYERNLKKFFDVNKFVVVDKLIVKFFANIFKRRDWSSNKKTNIISSKSFDVSIFKFKRFERSLNKKQSSFKRTQSSKIDESHVFRCSMLTLSSFDEIYYYEKWRKNWKNVKREIEYEKLTNLLKLLTNSTKTFQFLFVY